MNGTSTWKDQKALLTTYASSPLLSLKKISKTTRLTIIEKTERNLPHKTLPPNKLPLQTTNRLLRDENLPSERDERRKGEYVSGDAAAR